MTPRRTTMTALSGSLALLALAGCTKPTPAVTLVSDGQRVRTEATLYCRDGQSPQQHNCASAKHGPTVLSVRAGAQVGVDVDKTLADHGWFLRDPRTNDRSPVQDTHYMTFTADFSRAKPAGVLTFEVVSVDHVAEDARITGTWVLQLVQR